MSSVMDAEEARALRKSVKLDRYAEILAHVVHFGDGRAEAVVSRFSLSLAVWKAVDAAWINELSFGIRRQQLEQGLRFSATFARFRERLAREQPALETVGDAAAMKPKAGEAPAEAGAAPVPATAVPSFMAAQPKPSPSFAAVPPMEPPAIAAPAPVSMASVPMVPVAMAPAPVGPVRPPVPTRKLATMAMLAAPVEDEPLPFDPGVAPEIAIKSAVEHAEAMQGPKIARSFSLDSTSPDDADRIAAIARRVLPFPGSAGRPPPAGASPPAAAPPPPAAAPPAPLDAPVASSPAPAAGPPAPAASSPSPAASPSAPAASSSPPAVTLEQHALIHAELALSPDQKAHILRRHHLTPESHNSIDNEWQAKIAQDTNLRAAWDHARAHYEAWLRQQAKR